MKIAQFSISEEQFNRNEYLNSKFDYHTPIQIVASVSHPYEGTRYLVIKHKPHDGSANFSWVHESRFTSFSDGITLEKLEESESNNPYYWVHENKIRLVLSSKSTTKSTLSGFVLQKFHDDEEE